MIKTPYRDSESQVNIYTDKISARYSQAAFIDHCESCRACDSFSVTLKSGEAMSHIAFIHTPHTVKNVDGKWVVVFYCAIADIGDAVRVHHHRILHDFLPSGNYAPLVNKAGVPSSRTAADWKARCAYRSLPLLLPGTSTLIISDDRKMDGQYDLRFEDMGQ